MTVRASFPKAALLHCNCVRWHRPTQLSNVSLDTESPRCQQAAQRVHLHEKRNLRDGLLPSNRVRTTANPLNEPDSWNRNPWNPTYENRAIVYPRFPSHACRFIDIRRGESSHVRQKWYGIKGLRHQPQKQVYGTTQLGPSDTEDGDRLMTFRLGKCPRKPAFTARHPLLETT